MARIDGIPQSSTQNTTHFDDSPVGLNYRSQQICPTQGPPDGAKYFSSAISVHFRTGGLWANEILLAMLEHKQFRRCLEMVGLKKMSKWRVNKLLLLFWYINTGGLILTRVSRNFRQQKPAVCYKRIWMSSI